MSENKEDFTYTGWCPSNSTSQSPFFCAVYRNGEYTYYIDDKEVTKEQYQKATAI